MKKENRQEKSIRFITSDYTDLFYMQDGGTILVTFPDRQFVEKCEYIDEYHMKVGMSVYHICEYAELLERNGARCEPEPETILDQAAWQIGRSGYLKLERTETGFRYEILTSEFLPRTQGQLDDPSWTMNHAREHILETTGLCQYSRTAVSFEMVERREQEILKAAEVVKIEWKDSRYYPGMRTAEHTLTCEIRGETTALTYEVSQHDDGEGFVIHSQGKDIWDLMPEPELRKLEPVLARAVDYGHWKKDIDEAKTVGEIRDVRFSLFDSENLSMTREQIRKLHAAIDHKETMLMAAKKAVKHEKRVARKTPGTKKPQPDGISDAPEPRKPRSR